MGCAQIVNCFHLHCTVPTLPFLLLLFLISNSNDQYTIKGKNISQQKNGLRIVAKRNPVSINITQVFKSG